MLFDEPPGLSPGHRPPDLSALRRPKAWQIPDTLPELEGFVAIDLETRDPTLLTHGSASAFPLRKDAYVVGVAIASVGFRGYLPIRHDSGTNSPLPVWQWLKAQVAKPEVTTIYANAPYDLAWMMRDGFTLANYPWDVQGMAALLDEYRLSYSLESLGQDFLGRGKVPLDVPKDDLWQVPPEYIAPYAEGDARLTLDLFHHFLPMLQQQDLMRVVDIERPCLTIATEMRLRGVRYDLEGAERVRQELIELEHADLEWLRQASGIPCTSTDNDSLGRVLEFFGYKVPTTSAGRASIQAPWLDSLEGIAPQRIRSARRWNKARTSFVEPHMEYASASFGAGRIHGEFNPLRRVDDDTGSAGTVSGRFSGNNPNLQNIPARDPEVRRRVRRLFLPDQGAEWGAIDYSSQEPRLTVHFAYEPGPGLPPLPGAAEAVRAFRKNPRLDYHQMTAGLMGVERKPAKAINLGLTYGMGGAKLCHTLGLPTRWIEVNGMKVEMPGTEGARLLELYNERVPFARKLFDFCAEEATRNGYITTILGRRCRMMNMEDEINVRLMARKMLNRRIQGSAADQMKTAMLAYWEQQHEVPVVTVHDEVGINYESDAQAARIAEMMQDCMRLHVPSLVDVTHGPTWGDAKE